MPLQAYKDVGTHECDKRVQDSKGHSGCGTDTGQQIQC